MEGGTDENTVGSDVVGDTYGDMVGSDVVFDTDGDTVGSVVVGAAVVSEMIGGTDGDGNTVGAEVVGETNEGDRWGHCWIRCDG